MRKALTFIAVVFALSFAVGATLPAADAGPCYYKCICSVPHKCCIVGGVETCKPAPNGPLQCPQDQPC